MGKLVAQFDPELRAVQTALAVQAGDVELPLGLGGLFLDEGGRGKQEANLLHAIQLLLQLLVGVDGKAGGGDGELAALMDSFR